MARGAEQWSCELRVSNVNQLLAVAVTVLLECRNQLVEQFALVLLALFVLGNAGM